MDGPLTARGYWVERAGSGALRERRLPAAGPGDVVIDAICSGVSCGTERLVGRGQVPAACAETMACPGMQGSFALPILYGYSLVGTVRSGPLAGRRAFTMHPHEDRAVVPVGGLVLLPDDVPSPRATLLPNLETALNATWDAELRDDEPVVVLGAGPVGLLLAFVLSRLHRGEVSLVEVDPARRRFASALPWTRGVLAPFEVPAPRFAAAFHTTATSAGLQLAIDSLGFEGRVVELSWYGTQPVSLRLGDSFHHQRKRILASQVGSVAPSHRRAGREARTDAVLQLLRDPPLDALLGEPIPFVRLPEFFGRLYRGESTEPCPLVAY